MKVSEVMTRDVVTAGPDTPIREVAQLLLDRGISGVPIVDGDGRLLGIVSEGDLVHRAEIGAETKRSWWLDLLTDTRTKQATYVREHAKRAGEVMTRTVVTTTEDAALGEAARLLEKHRVKRLPVMRGDRIVGIVSRANILRGFAGSGTELPAGSAGDHEIRATVLRHMSEAGVTPGLVDAVVRDGVVQLWGAVQSDEEERAAIVAAETTPGVRVVESHLGKVENWAFGY